MTYKEEITAAMDLLAEDPLVRFIGYGVRYGGKAMGTLRNVPESQLIETPVAENLMVGLAIGMALKGLKPIVFIERFDFIMDAMDAIVNHLDKIETVSRGEFAPRVILRVVVGNSCKPLFTGETHTQDFTDAMRQMVCFPIFSTPHEIGVQEAYLCATASRQLGWSSMVVERKDLM